MFIYYFLLLSYIVPQYWIEAIIFYLMLWAAPEFKFNLWSCLPVDATKMRKKYWIQQIYSRLQTIEQLWPSSIYALDTRWWSGNGHLLQNENYHKKLRKRLCSVLTPNVEYYRFEDVALGNSLYTIHILLLSIPRKYIKSYRNMNEKRKYTMLRYFIKTYVS